MSQSDYIKFKKTSSELNINKFPRLLVQSAYLNNKEYLIENSQNNHVTFNQLKPQNIIKIYGMEVLKQTYSNCVKNCQLLNCYPKSNFQEHPVIGNQYNPTVKIGVLSGVKVGEPKCIYKNDGLYCNKNKILKPIPYIKEIRYIKYKKMIEKYKK